jgi:hypothetical protein
MKYSAPEFPVDGNVSGKFIAIAGLRIQKILLDERRAANEKMGNLGRCWNLVPHAYAVGGSE